MLLLISLGIAYVLLVHLGGQKGKENPDYTKVNEIAYVAGEPFRGANAPDPGGHNWIRAGGGNQQSTRSRIQQNEMQDAHLVEVQERGRGKLFDDAFKAAYQDSLAQHYNVGPGATGWPDSRISYWYIQGNEPRRLIPHRAKVDAF